MTDEDRQRLRNWANLTEDVDGKNQHPDIRPQVLELLDEVDTKQAIQVRQCGKTNTQTIVAELEDRQKRLTDYANRLGVLEQIVCYLEVGMVEAAIDEALEYREQYGEP